MKMACFALAGVLMLTACSVVVPQFGGPSDTVRAAFERMAAHDLAGASALVCPAQRDPRALPFIVSGIFEPVGYISGSDNIPETLAMIELDISDVRIGNATADGGSVLVPVSGTLRERLDPVELEAAWRATAAERGEAVDEAWLQDVLTRVRSGPIELELDSELGAVQVMKLGGAWLICQPLPSPGPEAPATSEG
jgi:hypothetical protein